MPTLTLESSRPMTRRSMDPFELARRSALLAAGLRPGDLADRWDVSPSLVTGLLKGTIRSWDREQDFAALVGQAHAALFAPHPHHDVRLPPTRRRARRAV